MIQPPDDRRPPLTPQLALRVAVIGGFALAMFAIIFFRLWYLQVLSGQQYVKEASANFDRTVDVPAPRGDILDANGNVLVTSRSALDVQIAPPDMPVAVTTANMYRPPRKDAIVYRRLARVLGVSTRPVRGGCRLPKPVAAGVKPPIRRYRLAAIPCDVAKSVYQLPFQNVTIKRDVAPDIQYYLAEREEHFPGVIVEKVYVRSYPLHGLAAQLFGTIGPITPQEVKERRFKGVSQNAIIGQSGLEAAYDKYLRGIDGSDKIQVNSVGEFQRYLRGTRPIAGHDLQLSLDINLQRVGQAALAQSIASNPPANGGAFVAMNPDNGEIYAMGSLPTFDPNIFAKPLSEATYRALNNPSSNFPLINRAINSAGPTGSTFKPITATAALESGVWQVGQTYDDTGQFCEGTLCRRNAGGVANGVLDLVNAIRVSDDVFFYNLGALTNDDVPQGGPLQKWAHLYGVGEPTGVDLPGETVGTLPSPAWRAERNRLESECDNLTHPTKEFPTHPYHKLPPGGCLLADGTNRPWSAGDNVNLAVGQGDVQVTPLQLAVVYSAIANGGTIVRPHVGLAITSPNGTVLQKIQPPATRHIAVNPLYLSTIRQGLHEAAQSPGGTSDDVMGNFPEPVYGKTGTAQYNGQQDYSWYTCFVPSWAQSNRPPIEIVVWVEQGGFGAVAAAPVAREMLSQWFFNKRGQYVAGKSTTL